MFPRARARVRALGGYERGARGCAVDPRAPPPPAPPASYEPVRTAATHPFQPSSLSCRRRRPPSLPRLPRRRRPPRRRRRLPSSARRLLPPHPPTSRWSSRRPSRRRYVTADGGGCATHWRGCCFPRALTPLCSPPISPVACAPPLSPLQVKAPKVKAAKKPKAAKAPKAKKVRSWMTSLRPPALALSPARSCPPSSAHAPRPRARPALQVAKAKKVVAKK